MPAAPVPAATRMVQSPLGVLRLDASPRGVCLLWFDAKPAEGAGDPAATAHLNTLARELDAYFAGTLTRFTVPLDPAGTPFQRRVWDALLEIPCGRTSSYADIARAIGNPAAVRAVGLANGANPIAIVIPCHRVIGSSGKLTGYGGELWRKQWLLDHERQTAGTANDLFSTPEYSSTSVRSRC